MAAGNPCLEAGHAAVADAAKEQSAGQALGLSGLARDLLERRALEAISHHHQLLQPPGPGQLGRTLEKMEYQPARLSDADERLQALYTALQARVDTPDPERARQQLESVLAMPRYAGLTSGPSLVDRILGTVTTAIGNLLRWLGANNVHLNVPVWLWLA